MAQDPAQDPKAKADSAEGATDAQPEDAKPEEAKQESAMDSVMGKLSAFGAKASEVAQDVGYVSVLPLPSNVTFALSVVVWVTPDRR